MNTPKKITYKEPAFLRDIHRNQISGYNKTKSLTVQERISYLVKQAHRCLNNFGFKTVEFAQR